MTADVSLEELRELQIDYLADVRDKLPLMKKHATDLGAPKRFKTSFPLLLFLAHQLKGSGASLGFPRISELAAAMGEELNLFLDDEAEERRTPKQLSTNVIALTDELDRVLKSAESGLGNG